MFKIINSKIEFTLTRQTSYSDTQNLPEIRNKTFSQYIVESSGNWQEVFNENFYFSGHSVYPISDPWRKQYYWPRQRAVIKRAAKMKDSSCSEWNGTLTIRLFNKCATCCVYTLLVRLLRHSRNVACNTACLQGSEEVRERVLQCNALRNRKHAACRVVSFGYGNGWDSGFNLHRRVNSPRENSTLESLASSRRNTSRLQISFIFLGIACWTFTRGSITKTFSIENDAAIRLDSCWGWKYYRDTAVFMKWQITVKSIVLLLFEIAWRRYW